MIVKVLKCLSGIEGSLIWIFYQMHSITIHLVLNASMILPIFNKRFLFYFSWSVLKYIFIFIMTILIVWNIWMRFQVILNQENI